MEKVKNRIQQERVVFGPGINPQQQGYANNPPK